MKKKMIQSKCPLRLFLTLFLLLLAVGGTPEKAVSATREVVDMAGRRMRVPAVIKRVYTGKPGSVVLYAVAPDMMVSRGLWTTDGSEKFMLDSYLKLPFVDGSTEEIMRLRPDIIIYWFNIDQKSIDEANRLFAKTGIPVFMVDMNMEHYARSFGVLGNLLGRKSQTDKMSRFLETYLRRIEATAKRIPENRKVRVYYAEGGRGLNTDPSGSFHSQVLDLCGGVNVAKVDAISGKGMSPVSMEQLLLWNPDLILVWTGMGPALTTWRAIVGDSAWSMLPAVRNHRIYQIPNQPFGWFDRPPGTNRILGAVWVAQILYPDIYHFDLERITREYFTIFYHRNLTDAELQEVLHPISAAAGQKVQVAK
jgi:iron complex transport system substrate-binding protein